MVRKSRRLTKWSILTERLQRALSGHDKANLLSLNYTFLYCSIFLQCEGKRNKGNVTSCPIRAPCVHVASTPFVMLEPLFTFWTLHSFLKAARSVSSKPAKPPCFCSVWWNKDAQDAGATSGCLPCCGGPRALASSSGPVAIWRPVAPPG